ncbi:uncharacterized protein [Blastocystis hominis]|uniref:Uncharacterized protein n=1 Tax=Blastocystis hominis TaxID=12968 RepID=D8LZQ8_BLAHO|nr:uncharacterized protein [Blastocystis hominis]CBK21297.2 unnamed protein product [Blastocystis hominis]|eukprot:XP_012895345.1 uncharacterized protein [Blastocystis hominis]
MDTSTENFVDALAVIKQQTYTLKKYIDEDNYSGTIAASIQLLNELKNENLNPKDYYEVYILFV